MDYIEPFIGNGSRPALTNSVLQGSETQATPVNTILDTKEIVATVLGNSLKDIQLRYPSRFDFRVLTTYPKSVQDLDPDSRNIQQIPRCLITVTRVSMPEVNRFIGNLLLSTYTDQETAQAITTRGSLQNDVIELSIWTLHPILRDKINILIRQIMFEQQDVFYSQYGFIEVTRTGGRDDEIDVGKLPRTIYRASAVYLCRIKVQQFILDDLVQDILTLPEFIVPATPFITGYEVQATPFAIPSISAAQAESDLAAKVDAIPSIGAGLSTLGDDPQDIDDENTSTPTY